MGDTDVLALTDTGASLSLLRGDVARRVLNAQGRPFRLAKCQVALVTLSGDRLNTEGALEVAIPGVGVVRFIVVQTMSHECILGWDQLHRHGWAFDSNKAVMRWGGRLFCTDYFEHVVDGSGKYEAAFVDADFLTPLLAKHHKVFGEPGKLPIANLPKVQIETEPGVVVAQRPYRTALAKRDLMSAEIDKMLALRVIRPSKSPFASPVTLVPKSDNTTRFCIDYRQLNSITKKDRYPLPLIRDIFDQLSGAKVFSTMDMRSGYWQLPMDEASIEKTAFVCFRGQYEFLRLPFGLANAPSIYSRVMNQVLGEYIGKFVLVFIDDIVVYSKTDEEHMEHVRLVLEKLEEHGLTLKDTKCAWAKKEINLLGYVVGAQGVSAQSSKTEAIKALNPPTDVKGLRRFLGMTGYYRDLIPDYARHAVPLYELTRDKVPWRWEKAEQDAFDRLKDALCTERVIAHPRVNDPYILYTDACDYALGGILCQRDENGIERPIQYVSAKFSPGQRKWSTIEKEAYAVIYCLKKLRAYLLGSDFVVFTDHKPLMSLFTKEMVNTRIQRWAVLIAEYGAKIKYREGKNNVRADMLSRIEDPVEVAVFDAGEEWVSLEEDGTAFLPSETYDIDDQEVLRLQRGEFPEEYQLSANDANGKFVRHKGLLYSIARPQANMAAYPRLMLPLKYRAQILKDTHEQTGHAGLFKFMRAVQEYCVWPGMRKDVQSFVDLCGLCRVNNSRPVRPPMGEMPIATAPGQIVGIDLMGPLTESSLNRNRHLMVVIDHYSGWIEAYPLRTKANEGIWERMANDYVPRHGTPRILISDQGTEFRGAGWEQWLEQNGIEHRRTSGYNPQSNGKTERANGTIRRLLNKLVNGQRAAWEDQLGPALTAVRNNVSSVTGFSPFMLNHARPARHMVGRMVDGTPDPQWSDRLQQQAYVMAHAARATAASRYYNRQRLLEKANAQKVEVGDRVMVRGQRLTPLTAKWDHHFIVTGVRGKVITVLHVPTGKTQRWNRNKVRLVDPDVSWDGIRIRPRAQNVELPTTSTFAGPVRPPRAVAPLLPQDDEMVPLPARAPKRAAPDPQEPLQLPKRQHTERASAQKRQPSAPSVHSMQLRKRPRWSDEQMDVLCFCGSFFM